MSYQGLWTASLCPDDVLFEAALRDNRELAGHIIRTILGKDGLSVTSLQTQYPLKSIRGHAVVFDAHAVDMSGNEYDIEMQKDRKGASPRRARYYSAALTGSMLGPGKSYSSLLESYVIFLCAKDPYKRKLPLYGVRRTIRETGEEFNDGDHIIYFNAEYRGEDALGILARDLSEASVERIRHPLIRESVRRVKETEEGRRSMSTAFDKYIKEACEEARRETRKENSMAIARNLRNEGFPDDVIQRATKLSDKDMRKLTGKKRKHL